VLVRNRRGVLPAILVTRFDPDAGEVSAGPATSWSRAWESAVLGDEASRFRAHGLRRPFDHSGRGAGRGARGLAAGASGGSCSSGAASSRRARKPPRRRRAPPRGADDADLGGGSPHAPSGEGTGPSSRCSKTAISGPPPPARASPSSDAPGDAPPKDPQGGPRSVHRRPTSAARPAAGSRVDRVARAGRKGKIDPDAAGSARRAARETTRCGWGGDREASALHGGAAAIGSDDVLALVAGGRGADGVGAGRRGRRRRRPARSLGARPSPRGRRVAPAIVGRSPRACGR
jgi:hypothetical protein